MLPTTKEKMWAYDEDAGRTLKFFSRPVERASTAHSTAPAPAVPTAPQVTRSARPAGAPRRRRPQAAGSSTAAMTRGQASAVGRVQTMATPEIASTAMSPRGGARRCSVTRMTAAVHVATAESTSRPLGLTDEVRNRAIGVTATVMPGTRTGELDHRWALATARARNAVPTTTLATCTR